MGAALTHADKRTGRRTDSRKLT